MKELAYLLQDIQDEDKDDASNTIQITLKRLVLIRKQRSSRN